VSQGTVDTQIVLVTLTIQYTLYIVQLQIFCSVYLQKNYENRLRIDYAIAMKKVQYFGPPCISLRWICMLSIKPRYVLMA